MEDFIAFVNHLREQTTTGSNPPDEALSEYCVTEKYMVNAVFDNDPDTENKIRNGFRWGGISARDFGQRWFKSEEEAMKFSSEEQVLEYNDHGNVLYTCRVVQLLQTNYRSSCTPFIDTRPTEKNIQQIKCSQRHSQIQRSAMSLSGSTAF